MTSADGFDAIAAELYARPPGDFTSARNARARDLDGPLAAQVKALRKPLLAAWVVNLFAREDAAQLGQALELAAELREAQADLDAATMSRLNRERRALVRSLAKRAAELAAERGERITAATVEAVEQTLNAAMFDPAAAAAVTSGRLIRPLQTSGEGTADLTDAVAGSLDVTPPTAQAPSDEVSARRERKQAERAVRAAEEELERAERDRTDLERRIRILIEREQSVAEREKDLRAQLERVQAEATRLDAERKDAEKRRATSEDEVTRARSALDEAKRALGGR
ncbi:transposase [Microbacterium sp.]|uniref:transposase n=1 Tax=Microbacterium sp. TaxID=51671 RepID=UPI002810D426|nr:transposase [Microbacterium sp.]